MKTAVFIGRFQPFHEGHEAMIRKILETHDHVIILVRTGEKNDKNPFDFQTRLTFIREALGELLGKQKITIQPISDPGYDLTVFYGRKVGYEIKEIRLDEATESISATDKRKELGV